MPTEYTLTIAGDIYKAFMVYGLRGLDFKTNHSGNRGGRPVYAKATPRQGGFLAFWSRFAPGGAVRGRASAWEGVALAKSPAMSKRGYVLKIKNAL